MSSLLAATRAELIKIMTLRSGWVVTGLVLALHVLVSIVNVRPTAEAVAAVTSDGLIEIFSGQPRPVDAALVEHLVASSFQMTQFLPVLAAVVAGQEFRSHQLGTTLLAVPRRGRLLVAKTLAAAVHLVVVSVLIAGTSAVFLHAATGDRYPGLLLTGAAFLGQAKFVGYAVLSGLVTTAVTVIARSALIGIVVSLAVLAVTLTQVLARSAPALDALFPVSAGRNLLLDAGAGGLTAGPGHALLVLVGWALATTVLAGFSLGMRDAR